MGQIRRASNEGSIFSESLFLENTTGKFIRYFVKKGNEIKAGFNLFLSEDLTSSKSNPLAIHNSLMFANDLTQKKIKSKKEKYEITNFIIHFLAYKYKDIYISLSPHFEDLRPFLWFNYHNEHGDYDQNKFDISLRYTSYLDISELSYTKDIFETNIYSSMETLRKRHLKKLLLMEQILIMRKLHYYLLNFMMLL